MSTIVKIPVPQSDFLDPRTKRISREWNEYLEKIGVNVNQVMYDTDNLAGSLGSGEQGEDGEDGQPGADGAPGRDGNEGPPGADGADGEDGAPGADGINGVDGADGADGADGTNGTGALVYSNTTVPGGNTVASTGSETAFTSSYDITANTISAGDVIRLKLYGVYGTDAAPPTLRIRVKFDAVTMLDTGAFTTTAGVTDLGWSFEGSFIAQSIGGTANIEAQGYGEFSDSATTTLAVNAENTAPVVVDTTQILTITVTVLWGTSDPQNTITLREMAVYHDVVGTPAGGGYAEGTAFPGSPATDDKFYRNDLDLLCFYDGTRWLTVQQYVISLGMWGTTVIGTTGLAATTPNVLSAVIPRNSTYDFWAETWDCTTNVVTTNSGTHKWTIDLVKVSTASSSTVASFSTGTTPDTASTYTKHETAIGALLGTSHTHLVVNTTKVSSPGNIFIPANSQVTGRLVIT